MLWGMHQPGGGVMGIINAKESAAVRIVAVSTPESVWKAVK